LFVVVVRRPSSVGHAGGGLRFGRASIGSHSEIVGAQRAQP
jgi:hypothetical protein